MARMPLEGYRVIDMTEVWAGPMAASILGDLGAEVIRLQAADRAMVRGQGFAGGAAAAGLRLAGPPDAPRPWDRGPTDHIANRNKLGISLNVAKPKGKELFYRLVGLSDAFLIGFSAGTAARMQIDYQTLVRFKPDLVMLTFAGWGEKGPYQGYATLGSGPDAWTGHHYLRGYPGLDPTSTGPSYHADSVGALTIAFALMAALRHRDRTGEGRFMDLSMAEILLTHMPRPLIDWAMNNRLAEPAGNVDPETAPNGCYPCKDEDSWAVIVVGTDQHWQGLKKALGSPDWAAAREEIDAHLRAWTARRTHVEVMHALQAEGVPAGPVYRTDETFADPHLAAREYYRWVLHPVTGQYKRPGPLFGLPKTPVQFRRHTNLLGEHNKEVFCGLLGLSEDQYEELLATRVIANGDS